MTRRVRPCRPPVLGEPSVRVVRPQGEPRTKTLREGARPAPRLCPAPLGGDAHGGASEPPPRPRAAALAWRHRDTPPFACPAPAPGICRLELCFSQVTLLRGSPLASPGGCGRPFLWGVTREWTGWDTTRWARGRGCGAPRPHQRRGLSWAGSGRVPRAPLGLGCISLVTEAARHLLLRSPDFPVPPQGRSCLLSVFQARVVSLLRRDSSAQPGCESLARKHPSPACGVLTLLVASFGVWTILAPGTSRPSHLLPSQFTRPVPRYRNLGLS